MIRPGRRPFLLLVVLALTRLAAARGAEPAHLPPVETAAQARETLKSLDEAIQRQSRDLDELESLLKEYKDWGRLPRAADADAAIAARSRITIRFDALIDESWALSRSARRHIDAINFAAFAHAAMKGAGRMEFTAAAARAADYQTQHTALDQRLMTLGRALLDDFNERERALSSAQRAQARTRKLRRAAPWALGVGLLGGLAVLRLGRRRRPTPATMPAPALALPPAPLLVADRFEVGRLKGRGGIGDIYAATDKQGQSEVSLHRVRPELVADPAARERFLAQTGAVAALRHPNIPRILAVEVEGGDVFVAYEAVDGVTLEEALAERGRLPWLEALRALSGAGFALEAAHAAGLVHGSVSPAGIVLTRGGEARLMDFGVPPAPLRPGDWKTRPSSWAPSAYSAPEQENGMAAPSVDVFALGVCAYQAATGTVPFKGPDFLQQKFRMEFAPPSKAAPGIPARLDAVLQRALRPAPHERFASVSELVRALTDV